MCRYWTKSGTEKTQYLLQFVYLPSEFKQYSRSQFWKNKSSRGLYNTVNKSDIICLSETYVYSPFLFDNDNLDVKGYKLVRDDHPDDIKRGRVLHT